MTWIFSIFNGPSGFSANSSAEDVTKGIDGTGLTAIVTGATSGIGLETARVLALRGVHVVMPVRNVEVGKRVKQSICEKIPNAKLDVMELDLSSQASIRQFALEYISKELPLNILILNAGIMSPPFTLSKDNIELQFATNHIGHFLLTNFLLDTMKKTASKSQKEGRIVVVSSELHKMTYNEGIRFDKINDEKSYSAFYAYGQSKLANALHTKELARRLKEEGANVTVNALHPGVIRTNLQRNQGFVLSVFSRIAFSFLKNILQGAATSCYVALHPQVKGVSGEYFADSNISKASKFADDPEMARKLWDFSLNLTQSKYNYQCNYQRQVVQRQGQEYTYRDMRVSGASLGISGREDGVNKNKSTNNLSTKTITLGVTMSYNIGSTTQGGELGLTLEPLDHPSTTDGSKALHHHVEQCPGQRQFSCQ